MRNLALISSWDSFLPSSSSSITATTIDLDKNVIYVASEHTTLDGQVEVDVWKMNQSEGSNWVKFHRNILSCFHLRLLSSLLSSRFPFFKRWFPRMGQAMVRSYLFGLWRNHAVLLLLCVGEMSL